jgi:hypothetical protein
LFAVFDGGNLVKIHATRRVDPSGETSSIKRRGNATCTGAISPPNIAI